MLRSIILTFALLLASPASAQTADDAAANRLFVEAVQLWNRAQGQPVDQRPATLQRVQSNLKTIIERHSGSPLAVRLVIGETVGPLSVPGVDRAVRVAAEARGAAEARVAAAALEAQARAARAAGVAVAFRDCPECPEMVVVPAGRFTMGAAPGEDEGEYFPGPLGINLLHETLHGRAAPQIAVSIPGPLAIGRFEVTRGEFARFVAETSHGTGSTTCGTFMNGKYEERAGRTWRAPGFVQDDRHPVVCVSWDDAQAYMRWLSRKTGKAYRLLSEGEWEYAARAGTTTRRPWGDAAEAVCAHANIADASARRLVSGITWGTACDDGHAYTSPTGTYRGNAFGLHDMLGNLSEWTADCWNKTHTGAPSDGSARSTGDCSRRVHRGGSWYYHPALTRSADRDADSPGLRFDSLGFRVARPL
jgi:sulfatase modifying factor 1